MLMRRRSGKELSRAEEQLLRDWLSKSNAATYDAGGVLKNVAKSFLVPDFSKGTKASRGFGVPCKSHTCTSLAGDALKGLGGFTKNKATGTLPIEHALDPFARAVAVTSKGTILKHLRDAQLRSAAAHTGVIGAAGLLGAGAITGGRGIFNRFKKKPEESKVAKGL